MLRVRSSKGIDRRFATGYDLVINGGLITTASGQYASDITVHKGRIATAPDFFKTLYHYAWSASFFISLATYCGLPRKSLQSAPAPAEAEA